MIIGKVISGGQTGADLAGLKAAKRCGISTGGYAPRGYRTEQGPRRYLLKSFGLKEHSSREYPPRTAANIKNADVTLILASPPIDGGSLLTQKMCLKMKKPGMATSDDWDKEELEEVIKWVRRHYKGNPLIVNIAGNRESKSPGIGARATMFLTKLFQALNHG